MRKIISLLSNLWIISSTSLTVVACYKNVYKKPQLEDIASIESNLQEILDSKNNEGWKREDLQAKIDARYEGILVVDDEALLVHAFVKEMRPFTKTWIFIGEGTKNNDFTYEKSIQLDHNWNIDFADLSSLQDVIFQASEIELGFKKPEALSVLNEAIQKPEEYVLTDPKIEKQSEVDDQTQTLLAAIETFNNSSNRPADLTELNKQIAEAQTIQEGFKTFDEYQKLQKTIQSLVDFRDTIPTVDMEDEIQNKIVLLNNAIQKFENSNNRPAILSPLKDLLWMAKKIEQGHKEMIAYNELQGVIKTVEDFVETKPTEDKQSDVQTQTQNLNNALEIFANSKNRLADLQELQTKIDQASLMGIGYKTQEALDKLKEAIKDANDFVSSNPTVDMDEEIQHQNASLDQAIENFHDSPNRPADLSKLNEQIAQADGILLGFKTEQAFKILKTVIKNAKDFLNLKPTADQQGDVEKHILDLEEAITTFNKSDNRLAVTEKLSDKIAEAKKIPLGFKTQQALDKLKDVISFADDFLNSKPTADQQIEVDKQLVILNVAIDQFNTSSNRLAEVQGLTDKIDEAEKIPLGFKTQQAFDYLVSVITIAKNFLQTSPTAEAQNQVDAHTANLNNAIKTFNESDNRPAETQELEQAILDADQIVQGFKTDQAFADLKKVIEIANNFVFSKPTIDQQEKVQKHLNDLKQAVFVFNNSDNKPAETQELKQAIFDADQIVQGFKTDQAFNDLKAAIEIANNFLSSNPTIDQQEKVQKHLNDLKQAIQIFNNSKNRPAETQKLEQAILDADEIKIGYKTQDAFNDLKTAIKIAKDFLISCPTIDQQDSVQKHLDDLKQAIETFNNSNNRPAEIQKLKDAIIQAEKIQQCHKTQQAFDDLKAAIETANEFLATNPTIDQQQQVETHFTNLEAAIIAFNNSNNRPAEIGKLNNLINQANNIELGHKTQQAFDDLKVVIETANEFLATNPTIDQQQQVETHFTKLEAAITAFNNSNNRPAEIAKLNNLINQANNLELGHKTQQAFDDLKAAIAIVNQFLATKPTVDQQTVVDQHFTELSKAIDDFNSSENRIADVELLNQTIQIAQDIQQGYKTNEAFQILQDALKVAKDFMLITPTADRQTEVDEHWATLSKAIDDFNNSKNQLADVELLEQKIIEAGLIEQGDKTDEAFEILTTTINDADSFVKSKPTIDMQEQVKTHLNNLEEAIVNFHNSKNRSANVELLENKISEAVEIKIGVKTVNAFQTLRAAIGVAIAYFKTQPTIDQQVEVDRQLAILTAAIQTFNESEEDIVDSQTWYIDPSGREKKTHGSAPWGTKEITNVGWNNKGRAYKMPSTIEKVPNHISSRITNMEELFSGADKFNDDISQWNTSNVTNMSGMFRNASSFDQDLKTNGNAWNVAKADTMFEMFHNATAFNGDISNWNVSQVTTMGMMFQNARNFNQKIKRNGDVWNTRKVQNMIYMFNGASSFNQNISNWNVGKVINHASFSTNSKWLKEHQPQWKK